MGPVKIFGEEKYLTRGGGEKRRRKRGKIFEEGKYLARRKEERKGGKYLEWETSRM